jgi:hypothetical protein
VEVSNLKSERERIKLNASGSEERIAGLEAELEAAKQVRSAHEHCACPQRNCCSQDSSSVQAVAA